MIKQIDLNFEGTASLLFSCDKPFLHFAIQDIALYIPFMLQKSKKCFFCQESISNVINDQNKTRKNHTYLS